MSIKHILLAIFVTIIWGVNFTFIKWGLESFSPIMLGAMRFIFTSIPLVFFVKRPKFDKPFFIYAIGTFAIQYGLLFYAMKLGASPGLSALMLQIQVFITVFLAHWLLAEEINHWQMIGLMVAIIGLGLIGIHVGGDMPLLGFICILLAATGWSFGNVASKKLTGNASIALVVWGSLIVVVLMVMMLLFLEPNAWNVATFTQASMKSWLSLSFIVYLSTLVGFGMWTFLLQRNSASKVMPFALLVPVTGLFSSAVLTEEMMTWWKLLAMIFVIGGLIIANLLPRWRILAKK